MTQSADRTFTDLIRTSRQLDGEIYQKYKRLCGLWHDKTFKLEIVKTRNTPEKGSLLNISRPFLYLNFKPEWLVSQDTLIPLCDYLLRKFYRLAPQWQKPAGPARSGRFSIPELSPHVIPRSQIYVEGHALHLVFEFAFPAIANRIHGEQCALFLEKTIPRINTHIFSIEDPEELALIQRHIEMYQDQMQLRSVMKKNQWIAFIGEGSILPRRSFDSFEPLDQATVFAPPREHMVTVKLGNHGLLRGLAIGKGLNIITGGAYHGKSTLLKALESSVYNHCPGDGREWVLSDENAFKVRIEEGRLIRGTDVSPFLNQLPHAQDTERFSTDNASGATSQAANCIESLRSGATCLLLDEDDSSANFLHVDKRLETLLGHRSHSECALSGYLKSLTGDHICAVIMVVGSQGVFLRNADLVIQMQNYLPRVITEQARQLMQDKAVTDIAFPSPSLRRKRSIVAGSFVIQKRKDPFKVKVMPEEKAIYVHKHKIDLSRHAQIFETGQLFALKELLLAYETYVFRKSAGLEESVRSFFKDHSGWLNALGKHHCLSMIRPMDLLYVLNRFAFLKISSPASATTAGTLPEAGGLSDTSTL